MSIELLPQVGSHTNASMAQMQPFLFTRKQDLDGLSSMPQVGLLPAELGSDTSAQKHTLNPGAAPDSSNHHHLWVVRKQSFWTTQTHPITACVFQATPELQRHIDS